ncbi:MAG TPA: 3-methyl-2-oxobutanoate hydroxymethyltransferase [Micromonosporaceae bacterium]|nr:3-methyl-2-oxobutanoate hydroxymethyltransferase [Micromonosporaceae bacterium]
MKAQQLLALHEGPVLVLPNAWDAGSAAVIASAGAQAIATTSAGVSWALGSPDGQQLTRDEMLDAVARIARAVEIPVTADVEAGYDDVAGTIAGVLRSGAVGVNLEDSRGRDGLLPAAEQAQQLALARQTAIDNGVPELVINARTDVYLFQVGAPETRLGNVLERATAYAEAGADVLFVPGLLDLAVLDDLVKTSPLPISVMATAGGPTVAQFAAVGVRRVSVGSGLAQHAYTAALQAAREMLTEGTFNSSADAVDYGTINGLFRR